MAQRDEAGRLDPDPSYRTNPEITSDMRANARANPNSWLYVIDEAFDPGGRVPPWAVVGAYPVNGAGDIVEDFHANDRYRPSPQALGFPEPDNDLERMMQLVRTRHRPKEDLPRVVLDATLYVYALAPAQQSVMGFHDSQGRVVVPAYTTKSLVPREWPHSRPITGWDIVDLLGGHPVAINPEDIVTAVVPAAQLIQATQEGRGRRK